MGTSSFSVNLEDLVIASGAAVSRSVKGSLEYDDAVQLIIESPAALDAAHSYEIQVSFEDVDGSYVTLKSNDGASTITPPAAGTARGYTEPMGHAWMRLKDTTGNAASDRTFKFRKNVTM